MYKTPESPTSPPPHAESFNGCREVQAEILPVTTFRSRPLPTRITKQQQPEQYRSQLSDIRGRPSFFCHDKSPIIFLESRWKNPQSEYITFAAIRGKWCRKNKSANWRITPASEKNYERFLTHHFEKVMCMISLRSSGERPPEEAGGGAEKISAGSPELPHSIVIGRQARRGAPGALEGASPIVKKPGTWEFRERGPFFFECLDTRDGVDPFSTRET